MSFTFTIKHTAFLGLTCLYNIKTSVYVKVFIAINFQTFLYINVLFLNMCFYVKIYNNSIMIQLRKFGMSEIKDDKVVVLIGKRDTGKCFL